MMTRREVVTSGALGALAAAETRTTDAAPTVADGGGSAQSPEVISAQALREIADQTAEIRRLMRDAFIGPSVAQGLIVELRRQFGIFLKGNQKYPDFCEIGPAVFTDVYDWHVRFQQPIEMTRVDNRTAIRFMFTWLILRPEQADGFVGIPFDRG